MQTKVELERWRRIMLSMWAYGYEVASKPLVDDATFDHHAFEVNLSIDTGRPDLDEFFREKYDPNTGKWIWDHPELEKVAKRYRWLLTNYGSTMLPSSMRER